MQIIFGSLIFLHRINNRVVRMLLLMLSKNIIESWVIKLASSRPILYDSECTEMYIKILMTHNIKNYEKLWSWFLYSLAMQNCKYFLLNFVQNAKHVLSGDS